MRAPSTGAPCQTTKGKVERTVSHVKQSFWAGISFTDVADLNRQAYAWCESVNEPGAAHCAMRLERNPQFGCQEKRIHKAITPGPIRPANEIDNVKLSVDRARLDPT